MASAGTVAPQRVNIAELINKNPFSNYQLGICLLCLLVVILDGFDNLIIGVVAPKIAQALKAGPQLYPKRLLTVIVPDDKVKGVVETIIKVNQTGNAGDGKVFVMPLMDAVRVRTGETGDLALDETP